MVKSQPFARASKARAETITSTRVETSQGAEDIDDPEEERIWKESKSWDENRSWEDDDSSDEDEDSNGDLEMASKPKGITESDWRVYEAVCAATTKFETKFKAMWDWRQSSQFPALL